MFIKKSMQDAINEQIKNEFYSAYLYLSMAAHFETLNLGGFATWLRIQSQEEQVHALKFYDYILERGGKVELKPIDQPPSAWETPLAVFRQVLEHEQHVTDLINSLYEKAVKENDYPSQVLLQWYITEQVEEEKSASEIVAHLELVEARGTAIMMLDHQLGKRGKEE